MTFRKSSIFFVFSCLFRGRNEFTEIPGNFKNVIQFYNLEQKIRHYLFYRLLGFIYNFCELFRIPEIGSYFKNVIYIFTVRPKIDIVKFSGIYSKKIGLYREKKYEMQ